MLGDLDRAPEALHHPRDDLLVHRVVLDGEQARPGVGPRQEIGEGAREVVRFGTARDGSMRPIAAGHAADYLADDGTLTLAFDEETLKASGLSAPYQLRALQLTDQGRMSVLHRQADALTID